MGAFEGRASLAPHIALPQGEFLKVLSPSPQYAHYSRGVFNWPLFVFSCVAQKSKLFSKKPDVERCILSRENAGKSWENTRKLRAKYESEHWDPGKPPRYSSETPAHASSLAQNHCYLMATKGWKLSILILCMVAGAASLGALILEIGLKWPGSAYPPALGFSDSFSRIPDPQPMVLTIAWGSN